ncbi:lamin tail domain-containing protein 1 [Tenrec ecaudatus]|uniref:lamin tail domain-containing protein 1 n=1 Tax=Tenrec ecaudatus TaxID=94439 RepID=UPI003F5A67A7
MSESFKSCALGHMKITDVHNGGLFVRLMNSSQDKELEIGNHYLQQNLNDHKVASYQFPPNLIMPAKCTVTVWAAASEAKHGPPSDFLWKKQNKFITSPNCTTILCKPNGEAIAWYTPIHWKQAWEKLETDIEFNRGSIASQRSTIHRPTSISTIPKGKHDHPERVTSSCQVEYIPVLQREKEIPPTLFPTRSPWCHSPNNPGHPYNPLTKLYRAPNARTRMATGCRHHSAWPGIFPGYDPEHLSKEKHGACLLEHMIIKVVIT